MELLVLQLGIIVMCARFVGLAMRRFKLPVPSVLIEVLVGVAIGPYLLGGLPLPGFPEGVFPICAGSGIPVSPELYGIATIASIIMLFSAGLETNLALLLRFSFVGLVVGFCGVAASFAAGAAVTAIFFGLPFNSPVPLFLGVLCASSSTSIAVRVLSEKRKMDSTESVAIMAGMLFDDVFTIVTLTAVTGFAGAAVLSGAAGSPEAPHAAVVVAKAVLVWLGFTAAGIIFAAPLSRALKKFKTITHISVFAFSLALILAGIFEMAGLAMIMGAYVVGLSLSKTDLSDTVRDTLETLHTCFVPVFFIVMGMLVDMRAIMSKEVLTFGAIYAATALTAKFFGCGIPTLFMNFNRLGAMRIGTAMAARGEVAFIAAGIGLAAGIIDTRLFGAGIMMVLATDFIAAPFLSMLFNNDKKGTKKNIQTEDAVPTLMNFATRQLAQSMEQRVVQTFREEGFYIHSIMVDGHNVYHLRKNDTMITMHCWDTSLEFKSNAQDIIFVKTMVYETLLQVNTFIKSVKDLIKPESEELLKGLTDTVWHADAEIKSALSPKNIVPKLKAQTKREVIEELVDVLYNNNVLRANNPIANALPVGANRPPLSETDKACIIDTLMEREEVISTGMQYGIAIPHCRTGAVGKITVAVGLSQNGIKFQSIDGEPSKIFVLILTPDCPNSPHIQFLANIAALLNNEKMRAKLLSCESKEDIYQFFMTGLVVSG